MSITAPAFSFGPATDGMRNLLRAEALALLLAALFLYARVSADWLLFAKLSLLPDIGIAFYLFGSRIGAVAYNTTHAAPGALVLVAFGTVTNEPFTLAAALIWLAHIGFDRALGYGLKYASGFGDTHLGRIGRQR